MSNADDNLINDFISDFVEEISPDVTNIENLLLGLRATKQFEEDINTIFRFFHNIKGLSGIFDCQSIQETFHLGENILSTLRKDNIRPEDKTIETLLATVDFLKDSFDYAKNEKNIPEKKSYQLLNELDTIGKSLAQEDYKKDDSKTQASEDQLRSKSSSGESIKISSEQGEQLMEIVSDFIQLQNRLLPEITELNDFLSIKNDIQRFSSQLQNFVLSIRLAPVKPMLAGLNRIVKTVAKELNKDVTLNILGGDTQLDRRILDLLREPFVHMVRNSIDHGIETPEERKALNKNKTSTIVIEASQQSGQVVLSISDDGKGIDPAKVIEKALTQNLITSERANQISEQDALQLIFEPGFSTSEEVSNYSGRGVGMDSVKFAVESVGGAVDIQSGLGTGTKITLTLPLTLAIVKSLTFKVGKQIYAVPQINVDEVVTASWLQSSGRMSVLSNGQIVIHIRDAGIPVVNLNQLFKAKSTKNDYGIFIVVKNKDKRMALKVDTIVGTRDFVSQPLPKQFSKIDIINGVNQLNNGEYIGLLDLSVISRLIEDIDLEQQKSIGIKKSKAKTSSETFRSQQKLVFIKSERNFAIPVQHIREVFEIDGKKVEKIADKQFLTYRDKTYPILRLAYHFGTDQLSPNSRYKILIAVCEDETAAIVCEEFHGIHRLPQEFSDFAKSKGILGTVTRNDCTYLVPNIHAVFELEFPEKFRRISMDDSKFTVMIVEDDRFFATTLADYLDAKGIKNIICYDGQEAKETLEEIFINNKVCKDTNIINYIISDNEMPKMSGVDLLRWIRKTKETKSLQFSMCTAFREKNLEMEIYKLGVDSLAGKLEFEKFIDIVVKQKENYDMGVHGAQQLSSQSTPFLGKTKDSTDNQRVLIFTINQRFFGIDITKVKEISSSSLPTKIPGTIKCASNMISFRGNPIPVLDLRIIDATEGSQLSPQQIVCQFDQQLCAIWVDHIVNVKRIETMDSSVGVSKSSFGNLSGLIGNFLWDKQKCIALIDDKRISVLLTKISDKTKSLGHELNEIIEIKSA